MSRAVKTVVEEALGPQRTRILWTANYYPALPFAPQSFEIGALLPVMLYMARFGYRRGKGNFTETFGQEIDGGIKAPTIADVAKGLVAKSDQNFLGFDDEVGPSVLGDLLLAWCLEKLKHAEGHQEQVQRIYPTHYLASWLDLPTRVVNLRGVPELLTVLLANQKRGEWLEHRGRGHFPLAVPHQDNSLLNLFGRHVSIRGIHASDLTSDVFVDESANDIGIDELLAVRLAQACGSAPLKVKGKNESQLIQNRQPLAKRAAEAFREDLAVFIEVYGGSVPRQAFLQMWEAGIALSLTNILLSTARLLNDWEREGKVTEGSQQESWPLFVDASQGQDKALRDQSETSMTECLRRYEQLPIMMMILRVLDERVHKDRKLRDHLPISTPDATAFFDLLGEIYQEQHGRSETLLDKFDEDCLSLADALEADEEEPLLVNRLKNSSTNPVRRLSEALIDLMGDKLQRSKFLVALDSALMTGQPNGLAFKRRVSRVKNGKTRTFDLRSIVLSSTLLDFLVHRHLRKAARGKPHHPLSLQEFLTLLRDRYGLYVDREPPGQPMPQEVLLRNKEWLERRLRDLGLLIGVNDAESMKQLRSRFPAVSNDAN